VDEKYTLLTTNYIISAIIKFLYSGNIPVSNKPQKLKDLFCSCAMKYNYQDVHRNIRQYYKKQTY